MNDQSKQPRYTMVIQWSEEDQCYMVSLPEWRRHAYTAAHGATYEEAARNGREVLELLMENEPDQPPTASPDPRFYRYPGADVLNLPDEEAETTRTRESARQSA